MTRGILKHRDIHTQGLHSLQLSPAALFYYLALCLSQFPCSLWSVHKNFRTWHGDSNTRTWPHAQLFFQELAPVLPILLRNAVPPNQLGSCPAPNLA